MTINTEARRIAEGHERENDLEFLAAVSLGCFPCGVEYPDDVILFAETYMAQPSAERSRFGNAEKVALAAVNAARAQRDVARQAADRQRQVDELAEAKFAAKLLAAMKLEHDDLWEEAQDEAEAAIPE